MAIDKNKILTPLMVTAAALLAGAPSALALPEDYYAQSSRLASGTRWVKVKVTETGIHRVTHDQLREWGFSEPEKVYVYGYSGVELSENTFSQSHPEDLPAQYCEHTADALLFYGEGDVRVTLRSAYDIRKRRNNYSDFSCYFLSDAEPGTEARKPIAFSESETALLTHTALSYVEPEEFQPGGASASWFSNQLLPGESRSFIFNAADYTGDAYFTYLPVAKTKTRITVSPTIDAVAMERRANNYVPISSMTTDITYLVFNSLPNPSNINLRLKPGYTDFRFTFNGVSNSDWVAIDYACLMYQRNNRLADHGQLPMQWRNIASGMNVDITDATASTRVWDVTSPMSITPYETSFNPETGVVSITPGLRDLTGIVAFNPEAENLLVPEFMETVVARENLHAEQADYDMVIIAPDMFRAAAQRLAALHESRQQLKVKIVSPADIYNEFSSGAPSAIGMRRYMKMLHDRNPGCLKYLLLFGHTSSNPRFIGLKDDGSYVMTYEVEEDRDLGYTDWSNFSVSNFASDNYFGMLSDNFTIKSIYRQAATIGVGRFTVSSPSEADAIVDKVEHYLDNYLTSDEYSRTGAMGDSGDENAHTLMAEAAVSIMHEHQPDITAHRLYYPLYRNAKTTAGTLNGTVNIELFKREVKECLTQGVGLLGFSGHSIGTVICAGGLSNTMLPEIAFPNHPIVFLATCDELPIDRTTRTLGQELFVNPKAAVAVIGADRTVYLNRNKALFDAFHHRYFNPETGDCLGDVWRKSFNDIVTNYDQSYGINSLCYNLAGDPALPVAKPTHGVLVRTVNGGQPAESLSVEATKPLKIAGEITGADGKIDTEFNGRAIVSLYDGSKTVNTVPLTDSEESIAITVDHHLLARTGVTVKEGRWEATVTPPVGLVAGSSNRVQVWASDGADKMALGTFAGISVADPETASTTDTEGPEIAEMYINTPSFKDGDDVGSEFTLYAHINADPSGIRVSGNTLGNRLTVTLDGAASNAIASNALAWNPDGSVDLRFPYSDVTDGTHTLNLSVCDNAGNVSTRTVAFTVVNGTLTAQLSTESRIITEKGVIDINLPSAAHVTRVVIEDAAGNTVQTRSIISFPWNWTPDESLPDGNYSIRAYFTDGTRWGATDPLQVILIRDK